MEKERGKQRDLNLYYSPIQDLRHCTTTSLSTGISFVVSNQFKSLPVMLIFSRIISFHIFFSIKNDIGENVYWEIDNNFAYNDMMLTPGVNGHVETIDKKTENKILGRSQDK